MSLARGSEISGLPQTTLRDAHYRGELPVARIGRRWWIKVTDLETYINQHVE